MISVLSSKSYAISISLPRPNSNIVAGSTIIVAWTKTATPAISESSSTSSCMIQQPSSILVAPLLTAPTQTVNINNPNNATPTTNTTTVINTSNTDYGPTVTSAQVAGASICIVVVSSFIVCVYTMGKSLIGRRYPSRGLLVGTSDYDDSISQTSVGLSNLSSSTSANTKSVADRKKLFILENIDEEEIHYDNMYYGQHYSDGFIDAGGAYHLKPSPRQRSPSPAQRISSDNHIFGPPSQKFHAFYADLPLPPQSVYGSHIHPEHTIAVHSPQPCLQGHPP